ncbi:Uncharacterized protein APZ42_019709 [Daphnia magna]|uniref:Uncharacterized protein n=1 Tax=Daphnia magna TaxID=35525 RepID=A0A164Y4D3_9CRUS|nr:Uncharacterized protein APZ42_019709 [Daphnia magna]
MIHYSPSFGRLFRRFSFTLDSPYLAFFSKAILSFHSSLPAPAKPSLSRLCLPSA